MRDVQPFWFTPEHQPKPEAPVSFYLRPLNMPTYWEFRRSFNDAGVPGWSGVSAAFEYGVLDWKGFPEAFSQKAKREALERFDADMCVWIGQIGAQLYLKGLLTEDEKKTS